MKRTKQSGRGVQGDLPAWGAGWRAGPFTQVGRTHFARGWESSTVDGPMFETSIRQRNNQSSFSGDGDVTCVCLRGDSLSESPRKAQMLKAPRTAHRPWTRAHGDPTASLRVAQPSASPLQKRRPRLYTNTYT